MSAGRTPRPVPRGAQPGPAEGAGGWRSFPPFYRHLELALEKLAEGACVVRLPYQPHLCNSKGDVHGGVIASLLDITLSQAVRSQHGSSASVATVNLNVSFFSPARGELTGRGRLVRGGKTLAFAEGEVTDAGGSTVSRATATYRIIHSLAER